MSYSDTGIPPFLNISAALIRILPGFREYFFNDNLLRVAVILCAFQRLERLGGKSADTDH